MPPDPPDGLSSRSQTLWRTVASPHSTPARLVTIEQALRCLDRLAEIRSKLASEGLTVVSQRSGVTRAHPLLAYEAKLRQQFTRLWTALNLHSVSANELFESIP